MAAITLTGRGNAGEIADILLNQIQNSAMSCQLVDSASRVVGDVSYYLMVFDKYYMRNSSRASLTVTVLGHGDTVYVDVVGSGGGQGAFLNFSWGAEEDFAELVPQILYNYGFR